MMIAKCLIDEGRIRRMRSYEAEWFRGLRCGAEVTTGELAEQVGVEVDVIEALEHGEEEVPAALYPEFAVVFGVAVQDFAKTCLMYENPSAYEALFGALPESLAAAA